MPSVLNQNAKHFFKKVPSILKAKTDLAVHTLRAVGVTLVCPSQRLVSRNRYDCRTVQKLAKLRMVDDLRSAVADFTDYVTCNTLPQYSRIVWIDFFYFKKWWSCFGNSVHYYLKQKNDTRAMIHRWRKERRDYCSCT